MKTNVLLLGLVLGLLAFLANAPILGVVFIGLAVVLFVVRNGLIRR